MQINKKTLLIKNYFSGNPVYFRVQKTSTIVKVKQNERNGKEVLAFLLGFS